MRLIIGSLKWGRSGFDGEGLQMELHTVVSDGHVKKSERNVNADYQYALAA